MDALSELLRTARLTGGVFLRGAFTEPWCVTSAVHASDILGHIGPTDHLILYHYVVDGELTVVLGRQRETFTAGQVVVFPHNDQHLMCGRQVIASVPAGDLVHVPAPGDLMVIEHGGGGAATRIICGFLGGQKLGANPLFRALPAMIQFDTADAPSGDLIRTSLEFAARETQHERPGVCATISRISEMLFIEAVRSYVETLPTDAVGWAAALRDRAVSRAVALMHAEPARHWTVAELSRDAGASRSTLTEKFHRYLGCAPAEYLTRHRMMLAAGELAANDVSIFSVAEMTGYGSEAAFSRAFKRAHGVSPSVWRQTHRAA